MHYPEIYEANPIFDSLRNKKVFGEFINIDWIKCQIYGSTFYIPEMFPKEISSLSEILKRINNTK